jgi:hypothetical protein
MNHLAHAVYSLVKRQQSDFDPTLSSLEQTALLELQTLLQPSPQALADLLASGEIGPVWASPSPVSAAEPAAQ